MRIVIGTIILAAVACGPRFQPFSPATRPAPPDALARAHRALVARGESIESKDDAAGVLVTAWSETSAMGGETRTRWMVSVDGAVVKVDSQCQQRIDNPDPLTKKSTWESCHARQPGDRTAQAAAIADEIAR